MDMHNTLYIDGQWRAPAQPQAHALIQPATGQPSGTLWLGGAADVDAAVAAAQRAFASFGLSPKAERLALLQRVLAVYESRMADMAQAITDDMGAPKGLSLRAQAAMGVGHLKAALAALVALAEEEPLHAGSRTLLRHEPVGVCALITPWNWPVNQIACKVAPALAAGCTMVLKPSELAPRSALLWAEVMHEAGVPPGVFNLVFGDGPTVGAALSAHPGVDMVSFTGSNRAGVAVAQAAAPTVKRVHQELGGKSAHIVLPQADLKKAVTAGVKAVMLNSGQNCNAPTRLLVHRDHWTEALALAAAVAQATTVGHPMGDVAMGPVVSQAQWTKIQELIGSALQEGAQAVAGGLGRPDGLEASCAGGWYVKPTVLAPVTPSMRVAQEEIFGPVLVMMVYDTVDEAIALANGTPYGLAAYVSGTDTAQVQQVARRLRAGQVNLNQAAPDLMAPFGGYKQSGNGREWGAHGLREFMEVKALLGGA